MNELYGLTSSGTSLLCAVRDADPGVDCWLFKARGRSEYVAMHASPTVRSYVANGVGPIFLFLFVDSLPYLVHDRTESRCLHGESECMTFKTM